MEGTDVSVPFSWSGQAGRSALFKSFAIATLPTSGSASLFSEALASFQSSCRSQHQRHCEWSAGPRPVPESDDSDDLIHSARASRTVNQPARRPSSQTSRPNSDAFGYRGPILSGGFLDIGLADVLDGFDFDPAPVVSTRKAHRVERVVGHYVVNPEEDRERPITAAMTN